MRVYHFISSKFGLEDLKKQRLKISQIDKLNDPFEFLAVNLGDKLFRDTMNMTKNDLAKNRGILCFSKDWHNPLQWAHYADRHQGLCLGFDISEKLQPIPVRYIGKKYKFTNPEDVTEEDMLKLLSTKYTHWKYEKEIRLFSELGYKQDEHYFVNFSEGFVLKEVIIGYYSKTTKEEIIQNHGANDINIFKVRPAFQTFRMVRDRATKF